MKLSITPLLVVVLYPKLSLEQLVCYSCTPINEHVEVTTITSCKDQQEIVQRKCPRDDSKRSFCVVEQTNPELGQEVLTIRIGCSWRYYHNLRPGPDVECKSTLNGLNDSTLSKYGEPTRTCYCKTDLCNFYDVDMLQCHACRYPVAPYDYKCNDVQDQPIANTSMSKCALDEDICVIQVEPHRLIGCARKSDIQRHNKDKYNVKEDSYCVSNQELTACYCSSNYCNTMDIYQPPRVATSSIVIAKKSLPLATILLMSLLPALCIL